MKRNLCLFALLLTAMMASLLLPSRRAAAITYGFVDANNTFANTGAFISRDPATGEILPICSGTMITANVFLTASHCTTFFTDELAPNGFQAFVSLDGSIPFGPLTNGGTQLLPVAHVVSNPDFNQSQSDSGDIAVLILEDPVQGVIPATLPCCRLLDQLSAQNGLKTAVFTPVGYGLQNRVTGGGVPFFQDLNPVPRMFAFSSFNSLNKGYLRLSQNPATGNGGTCFGDSGGPTFLTVNGEDLLIAITIAGDSVCRSTNVVYRLDIASAQAFLAAVNAAFGTAIPVTC